MDFDDIEKALEQIRKDATEGLKKIAIQIQQDIRLFWLKTVYSREPKLYIHTEMLLESTKVSEPIIEGDEIYIYIYVDNETLHKNPAWYDIPELGITKGQEVTLEQVSEHMKKLGKDAVGETAKMWLDNSRAINELLNMLKSKYDVLR